MSTRRLETLRVLLEQERRRRDDAQGVLRGAQQHLEAQDAQGQGLEGYRADYDRRWSAQFQQGARMEILQAYHAFHARLDQAIEQQRAVVAHARRQVEAARERLVERELRVATVERLMDRQREALARQQARRDQKQTDEFAQRAARTRALAGLA